MSLSELCSDLIADDTDVSEVVDKDVMEFLTAPWGLGLGTSPEIPSLYPAQRFIIKTYYGMPLDNSDNRDIIINDKYNENELYRFNEQEYADYLFSEGRMGREYDETARQHLILVCGRRSGKTMITSCIIAYELYKLLNKRCPQEYYKIMPDSEIKMTCVSTSKETASELFSMVTGHIERSEFFRKYRTKPTSERIRFRTQRDLDKYGTKGRCSLVIRVAPCSAKGLRGPSNMIVALDEMAFFFEDESSGKKKGTVGGDKNDRAIFNAVTPSIAKFKGRDGSPDGKVISISSPGGKAGKFFEEYERSYKEDNDDLHMIQAPTWEIDPELSTQYLKSKYKENPIVYKSEFGAQFSDRLFGWIEDPETVRQNVVPGLAYKHNSNQRVGHFMGVDLAFKNDGAAVCIGHWTTELIDGVKEDKIELDVCDVRYPDVENKENFVPEELVDWIEDYTKRFYIVKGLMDQYYGFSVLPLLHKKGLKQFEYRQFTDVLNSNTYQNLLTTFISSYLRMPEGKPTPEEPNNKDSELVKEILQLQAEQRSKYIIKVHAPERKGCHDDASDGFARMVLLATEYKNKGFNYMSTGPAHGSVRAVRMLRHSEKMKAMLGRPSGRTMGRNAAMAGRPTFHSSYR